MTHDGYGAAVYGPHRESWVTGCRRAASLGKDGAGSAPWQSPVAQEAGPSVRISAVHTTNDPPHSRRAVR